MRYFPPSTTVTLNSFQGPSRNCDLRSQRLDGSRIKSGMTIAGEVG
jgi:hypothetical protein